MERNLVRLTILLFITLYASQFINFVMQQRGVSILSKEVESLEGKAVTMTQTQLYMGSLELRATGKEYTKLQIYINGDYYKNFDKESISLMVKNNDIIEISGIKSNDPVRVQIIGKSQNITAPELNSYVDVNKDFVIAGRVQLK